MRAQVNVDAIGKFVILFLTSVIFAMLSPAHAQEITSSVEVAVATPNGAPAEGVTATITDVRDGAKQTVTASQRGIADFRSVGAGGPYTIRIEGDNYEPMTITDIYTDVAGKTRISVTMQEIGSTLEEIVVTASQVPTVVVATGPSSTFSSTEIAALPSTQRQIRDVIRLDPRISIAATGNPTTGIGSGISCLGASNRTNSFTIDGVRATDAFGLNNSGNLSRFTFPIPFDAVQAAAVEFSPMSVEYGQFTGCNINVVTKSGGADFHGSVFYLYNDDSLTGDRIDGVRFDQGSFERKNWGVDIGGPIIPGTLFFYTAYEETDTAAINEIGTADSGFPRNDTVFTTAEVTRIRDILRDSYARDPGDFVTNLPVISKRLYTRFDWNISDRHRAEAAYASLEETTIVGDDIGTPRGEFTFSDNFHRRGSDSKTVALRLFSNWTDRLSTEFRYSSQDVSDLQDPLGGGEAQAENIPRIVVGLPFGNEFFGQQFASGPGVFRSANDLNTTKGQLKLKADYRLADHLVTAGYEYETLDAQNLFIINGTGTIVFAGIDELEAGSASNIRAGVSYTRDPWDAAATFTRDIHSLFIQDQWALTDAAELVFGLRYDWYATDDVPLHNENFAARYGFTNAVSFDGLDALQPRVGLSYILPDRFGDTRIIAGAGRFSGNDPTVWFSNAFQNFGGALGVGTSTNCAMSALQVLSGGSFQGVPECVIAEGQQQALNTAGAVAGTDPNLELPTVNRYNVGLEHNTRFGGQFWSEWNLKLDLIYSTYENSIDFVDLSLDQAGTAPDGRPTFVQVDPLLAGCDATFDGLRQGFDNVTPACFGGNQDVLLTNKQGEDGYTFTVAVQASKSFEWGDGWNLDLRGGYAYNESEVGNPGTGATAGENFRAVVASDITSVPVGPSFRNVPHNFVLATSISKNFFADYRTTIAAFFQVRDGHPISPVFNGQPYASSIGDTGARARSLLYVPTGASDPLVVFEPGFDTAAFFDWVDAVGLTRGEIAAKGSLNEDWSSDLDIRIQQELPFFGDANLRLFLDIENVLNLLDDSHGVKKYINTTDIASAVGVVTAGIDPTSGLYNFQNFAAPAEAPDTFDSLYQIQLGIRAEF